MAPKSLYQTELEAITKSRLLFIEDTDVVLKEIGMRIASCLQVARVNIWLFSETKKQLVCIANYDAINKSFNKGEIIHEKDIPNYYSHLLTDEILAIENVRTNPITEDLKDNYCKQYDIYSLMDVPIHIEGKLAGVMCYEQVGKFKKWTDEEQFFALSINQLVSLVLETRKRRLAQINLQRALEDKDRLLAEMHHRIKNNLSTLVSLLRIQVRDSKSDSFNRLAQDFESRIFSIAKIHEQLYTTRNYLDISLKRYIEELVQEYKISNSSITFELDIDECAISTAHIVPLGLVLNEIITNSVKYAFANKAKMNNNIKITLKSKQKDIYFEIADNGNGFDLNQVIETDSLGISLIKDLVDQLDGEVEIQSSNSGTRYSIQFKSIDIKSDTE